MGATLLAVVVAGTRAFWLSVGDSPLFHFRAGALTQLNDDHSLAPQIDMLVEAGLLDAESALTHPNRNTLTSAVVGTEIPKIDCPQKPASLQSGDILIAASDGIQFLSGEELEHTLICHEQLSSAELVNQILDKLHQLEIPDLDNIGVALIRCH